MRALKAHVRSGRILVDEPTDLPEGTEIELVPLDELDEYGMTPEERAELDSALEESEAEIARGESVSLDQLWETLRSIR
jgi:hypothetical protein